MHEALTTGPNRIFMFGSWSGRTVTAEGGVSCLLLGIPK